MKRRRTGIWWGRDRRLQLSHDERQVWREDEQIKAVAGPRFEAICGPTTNLDRAVLYYFGSNALRIHRSELEERVLAGLKSKLMAPELVEEFIREYHAELNRLRAAEDAKHAASKRDLDAVQRKIDTMVYAPWQRPHLISPESRYRFR